jgi:hypothetical protein
MQDDFVANPFIVDVVIVLWMPITVLIFFVAMYFKRWWHLSKWLLEVMKKDVEVFKESVKNEFRAHTAAKHPRSISETPISLPPPTVNAGEEPPHAR